MLPSKLSVKLSDDARGIARFAGWSLKMMTGMRWLSVHL
jgi:hypothetical protein